MNDPQSGLGRLASLGTRKVFPKHFCIAKPGDICNHCYLILKGRVVSFEYAQNGTERTYDVLHNGDVLLLSFALEQKPATLYFRTSEVTDTICIKRGDLVRAAATDSNLMSAVAALLASKYNNLLDRVCERNSHCVTWNLCNLFLSLAKQYGKQYDNKIMIGHKISQEAMGHLLGVNRVTITKIIQEIKELRLIEHVNGYYCVRDTEALRSFRDNSDMLRKNARAI